MTQLIVPRNSRHLSVSDPTSLSRLLSYGLSKDTASMVQSAIDLANRRSGSIPDESSTFTITQQSLPEQLFNARMTAKMLVAQVAMHLDSDWRRKLFNQLDSLHDPEEWVVDDHPVTAESFRTFLRTILLLRPDRRPGLGLSYKGNLIAAWTKGVDRLTLEFLPNDEVRWSLSCKTDDGTERAAGDIGAARLAAALAPYSPSRWFANAN